MRHLTGTFVHFLGCAGIILLILAFWVIVIAVLLPRLIGFLGVGL